MTARVQTLRFHTPGTRPASGAEEQGTLYSNTADRQIGIVDDAEVPLDLVGVRIFSAEARYLKDEQVSHQGRVWTALGTIEPGPFDQNQWQTGEAAVRLDVAYRDFNYDGWGTLGAGTYIVEGLDYQLLNAPWDLVEGVSYTVRASVVNDEIHSTSLLVGASSITDHDTTHWSRTGPDWQTAKTKAWVAAYGGPTIVSAAALNAADYKDGQKWFNPVTGREATKLTDDAGKQGWLETGQPALVSTNTVMPLQAPIYADAAPDPALFAVGQFWMDTLNYKMMNRYVDAGMNPIWLEFATYTPPA